MKQPHNSSVVVVVVIISFFLSVSHCVCIGFVVGCCFGCASVGWNQIAAQGVKWWKNAHKIANDYVFMGLSRYVIASNHKE